MASALDHHQSWTDRTTTKWRVRRNIGRFLLVASILIWFIPQDVPRMIAQWDHVLLGRYSVDRMMALIVVTLALWLLAKGIGWPSAKKRPGKHVVFAVVSILIVLIPALVVVDIALRKLSPPRYVEETIQLVDPRPGEPTTETIRRRPANQSIELEYVDEPPAQRSYPSAPRGYPAVTIKLSTDARGFRNPAALERADIICLGDSFTEGSHVDDSQTWPALLSQQVEGGVYNLGMSGGGPRFYLVALQHYGLPLAPKTVICMIYAGNDFKVEEAEAGADNATGLLGRIKSSPIRARAKEAMIRLLGPIGANATVAEAEALSWMPLAAPAPSEAGRTRYYAFEPKRLQRLYVTRESFAKSKDWTAAADVFSRIIETCKSRGIRIAFVYAPSTAAVVLPLAKDRIPAAALRAFLGYRIKDLPPAEEFKTQLFDRLDVQETMVADLCREHGAEFISLTVPLREAAARGVQVYYTYDQHWTAQGQAVAAEVIAQHLAPAPIAPAPIAPAPQE